MTVVAIAGRGTIARDHARAWAALGAEVRYVVATAAGPGLEAAPGARVITDLDVALADPDVSIVTVATPTPTHPDLAIRSLDAGRHVLLEKPVALTVADADRIAAAATDADRIVLAAQVLRFFPAHRAAADLVASGSLGAPIALQSSRVGADDGQAGWMRDEAQSGGMLLDLGIHELDQVVAVLGAPTAVTARRMPGIDLTALDIETASGAAAHVVVGRPLPPRSPFAAGLRVWGTEGALELSSGAAGAVLTVRDAAGERTVPVADADPFELQARHLLDLIAGDADPLVPWSQVRAALRLGLAARESVAAGGARIPLD